MHEIELRTFLRVEHIHDVKICGVIFIVALRGIDEYLAFVVEILRLHREVCNSCYGLSHSKDCRKKQRDREYKLFHFSDNYCCSTCCYHEHRAVGTDGFIVDIDAYDGVGSHSLSTLHHLLHGGVLGFGKHFLISASTTAYDVADASKQILKHVGTDNGFTCHHTLVLADSVTFNLWGSLQAKRLLRRRAVESIIIVSLKVSIC